MRNFFFKWKEIRKSFAFVILKKIKIEIIETLFKNVKHRILLEFQMSLCLVNLKSIKIDNSWNFVFKLHYWYNWSNTNRN